MQVEREDLRVALGGDGVVLEGKRVRGPSLGRDVGELRAFAGEQVVDSDGQLAGVGFEGGEDFDDGGAGVVLRDDERVRKHGGAFACGVMEDRNGGGELDARGHVNEDAVADEGGVQGAEFLGAEGGMLLIEIAADEIAMVGERVAQRLDDHSGGQLARMSLTVEEHVVAEDEARGAVAAQVDALIVAGTNGGGEGEALQGQAGDVAEAPELVLAHRHGQCEELVPGFLLCVEPPGGKGRFRSQMRGEDLTREAAERRVGKGEGNRGHDVMPKELEVRS
jgi:hypothetical protein